MRIIVGLGNPGKEYENTRHNVGYDFVGALAAHPALSPVGESLTFDSEKKFEADIARTRHDGEDYILVKPTTFMNLSGTAVQRIMAFYKANVTDLIVIADDLDLPLGQARVRNEGGSAGQKGLQNIIDVLGTNQFTRVRIGIGRPLVANQANMTEMYDLDAANYVLSKFPENERKIADEVVERTIHYVLPYLDGKNRIVPAHTIEI